MKFSTRLSIPFILAASFVSQTAAIAVPKADALPWAQANPQANAAANAYADAYAEAVAIAHPDPEAYALAASADDCASISCHASCGLLIIEGQACSTNTENTYAGPYNTSCLCSSGSSFLQYYAPCMDCGWTLWKYYGGYVSSALAACGSLATEPTGTSRCSTTLTDSYTIDTSIQGCSYLGNCPTETTSSTAETTSSTAQGSTAAPTSNAPTSTAAPTTEESSAEPTTEESSAEQTTAAPTTEESSAEETTAAPTTEESSAEQTTEDSSEATTTTDASSEEPSAETSVASSGASTSGSPSAVPSTLEPTFDGEFSNGALVWRLTVPSGLGPWTSVSVVASNSNSAGDFNYDPASVTSQGEPEVSTSGSSLTIELTSNVEDEDLVIEFSGSIVSGTSFTSDVTLTIDSPDGKRFFKRAENSWTLENTITVDSSSSAASSETETFSGYQNSSISTSTAFVSQDTTTLVTVTSCDENKCTEVPSTALVSVATTTINGVVTSYTTYCPLTTTTAAASEAASTKNGEHEHATGTKAPEVSTQTVAVTTSKGVSQQSTASEGETTLTSTVQAISTFEGAANYIAGSVVGVLLPFLFI